MLGMRGVRLGITIPGIYEMQARAIFEATVVASEGKEPVVPEIMIPLVSAKREVELIKDHVDAVAAAVRNETGVAFTYRLGVMVETPRAALRAGEIAEHSAFLSFGTNDLTQMTYGLSRDDAGGSCRPMSTRASMPKTRSSVSIATGWASCCCWALHAAARRGPVSPCRSAANMAVTPIRSRSAARRGSIMSPARRSGCRSPNLRRHNCPLLTHKRRDSGSLHEPVHESRHTPDYLLGSC